MLLNRFETLLINNPVRDRMLDWTVSALMKAAGRPRFHNVLEIGCGAGAGIESITRCLRAELPESIDAFDLDPKQVERARSRLLPQSSLPKLRLSVGDAERIDAPDASYDAVFEFTIFHHIPDWQRALCEVARVLRPGGFFLFEELSREFFHDVGPLSWLLRRYTDHPWDYMFDWPAFERGIEEAGLRFLTHQPQLVPGWHRGVVIRPSTN